MNTGSRYYQREPSREWYRTAFWSTAIVICVITSINVQGILSRGVAISTDCWHGNQRHPEGHEVATSEPCLNCTCSRGALLCYLRICSKLPDPPPPGCILLHRHRTCCPELICTDLTGESNRLEARTDPDAEPDLEFDSSILQNVCIENGTVYGPGSAMGSSSLCEYCYCLGGNQTCVKPKCLQPIEGCTPIYDWHSCCPIKYNCTRPDTNSRTTTELARDTLEKGGCTVDGSFYSEGSKVVGLGHSVCDNCYCIKGLLRCEPLSCAPALLGCIPTIKPGSCCAASYNCSGKIEIQPEPYYGHYPVVSKEYAKLRKVNQVRPSEVVTVAPFYVQEFFPKQRGPGTFGTTRHFLGVPLDNNTMKPSTKEKGKYHATTNYKFFTPTYRPKPSEVSNHTSVDIINATTKEEKTKEPDILDIFSFFESMLDENVNETVDTTITVDSVDASSTTSNEIFTTTLENGESTIITVTEPSTTDMYTTLGDFTITTESSSENRSHTITLKMILKSIDCKLALLESNRVEMTTLLPVSPSEINEPGEIRRTDYEDHTSTTEDFNKTTVTTETIPRNEIKVVSSATLTNILDIKAILNTSKAKGEDYDYEYGKPTLPPSLPNLRIIPFVAADALDTKKDAEKQRPAFSKEQNVTEDSFGYNNLFSPPAETEGGFLPKDVPVLDENFYENTVMGPVTASEQTPNDEQPIMVLDLLDNSQGIPKIPSVHPDPFSNAIRTEPAPNLESPLVTLKSTEKSTKTTTERTPGVPEEVLSLNKVLQLFLNPELTTEAIRIRNPSPSQNNSSRNTTKRQNMMTFASSASKKTSTDTLTSQNVGTALPSTVKDDNSTQRLSDRKSEVGVFQLISLAGCNIYGRMYRVGKIISELSEPCRECRCTEVGVKCKQLKC